MLLSWKLDRQHLSFKTPLLDLFCSLTPEQLSFLTPGSGSTLFEYDGYNSSASDALA